jgi:hypothetical protein
VYSVVHCLVQCTGQSGPLSERSFSDNWVNSGEPLDRYEKLIEHLRKKEFAVYEYPVAIPSQATDASVEGVETSR